MKKLLLLFIPILIILTSMQTLSADTRPGNITLTTAVELMHTNNTTIKRLKNNEIQAKMRYDEALDLAKEINLEGTTINISGTDTFFFFDPLNRMNLAWQRNVLPEQMKNMWMDAKESTVITENSLKVILEQLYTVLMSSDNNYIFKKKNCEIATHLHEQNKLKYKKGLISATELDVSEYEILKSQKELNAAGRDRDNAARKLNAFMGIEINRKYGQIIYEEKLENIKLGDINFYIKKAVSERNEIVSIERDIDFNSLMIKTLETAGACYTYTDIKDQYKETQDELESLKINLEKIKLDIEQEIRNAYTDIMNTRKNVENINKTLSSKKKNLDSLKAKYKAGIINLNTLNRAEMVFMSAENGYKLALMNYNTKLESFYNAAGLGPAFQ